MKNKIEIELSEMQKKAGKANKLLLYLLSIPMALLIISLLFDFVIIAEFCFWTMVCVLLLYIVIIKYYNYKIKNILKQLKK